MGIRNLAMRFASTFVIVLALATPGCDRQGPDDRTSANPAAQTQPTSASAQTAPAPTTPAVNVTLVKTLEMPDSVFTVCFAEGGKTLVVTGGISNEFMKRWDTTTWAQRPDGKFQSYVVQVVPSLDGGRVAVAGADPTIRIVDVATGDLVSSVRHEENGIGGATVAWSHDGTRIASSLDQSMLIWDTRNDKPSFLKPAPGRVHSVAFSPDDAMVVGAVSDWVVAWNASSGEITHKLAIDSFVPSWLLMTSKTTLLVAANYGVDAVDLAANTVKPLITTDLPPQHVAASPDGKLVAIAFEKSQGKVAVRIYDATIGAMVADLPGHTEKVYSLAFSPDGHLLATGSDDKMVRVWAVAK